MRTNADVLSSPASPTALSATSQLSDIDNKCNEPAAQEHDDEDGPAAKPGKRLSRAEELEQIRQAVRGRVIKGKQGVGGQVCGECGRSKEGQDSALSLVDDAGPAFMTGVAGGAAGAGGPAGADVSGQVGGAQ